MGVVPRRPVPPPNVLVARPYFKPARLRVRTWNPGAALGWMVAWVFSAGRYGRLPLYREPADYGAWKHTPIGGIR